MERNPQPDFYILIPCYNDIEGLITSLKSIAYHTEKFVVLIIDDGSRTPVEHDVLLPHLPPEFSVEIVRIPSNQGITKALNTGLSLLSTRKHRYVARLDCGDVCEPERFIRQVEYLEEHPEIGLIGSWCEFKDYATGRSFLYKTPVYHEAIEKEMYFRNVFIHPTVMWRASNLQQYPEIFPHAEDYGLFYEMLYNGGCAIIPEKLVTCKINPVGISISNRKLQLKSRMKVVKHFGRSRVRVMAGVLKLCLLLMIPYSLVLQIKRILYSV